MLIKTALYLQSYQTLTWKTMEVCEIIFHAFIHWNPSIPSQKCYCTTFHMCHMHPVAAVRHTPSPWNWCHWQLCAHTDQRNLGRLSQKQTYRWCIGWVKWPNSTSEVVPPSPPTSPGVTQVHHKILSCSSVKEEKSHINFKMLANTRGFIFHLRELGFFFSPFLLLGQSWEELLLAGSPSRKRTASKSEY